MKKINNKILGAVIGFGIGKRHAEVINDNKNSELVYVSDLNKNTKLNVKKIFKNTKSLRGKNSLIFKDKRINFVSIASYDNFHKKHVIECLKNNKNFFVEKPLCLNITELKNIVKEIKKKPKIRFSSNLVLRQSPQFLELKKKLKSNKLGEIYHLEASYNYGRKEKITKGWRGKIPFYSVTLGGGIHLIDLMIWLTGKKVKEVISLGNKISTTKTNFKHFSNVISILKFQDNSTAKINSNFSSITPHHHNFEMYGTKGSFIQNLKSYSFIFDKNKEKYSKRLINFKKKDKKIILDKFLNSIINNKKFQMPAQNEIIDVMSVALSIEKSLKSKKWEKVKYFKI